MELKPLPPSGEVPSAFIASVKQWWTIGEKSSALSEERLLRRLPFFRSPDAPVPPDATITAYSSRVHLSNIPKAYINTVSVLSTKPSSSAPPPAVLMHGYGAGLGFFYKNIAALSSWVDRRGSALYLADWLGMGRSARVPFNIRASRKDIPGRVEEAEGFFVDSLEEWRAKMGLEKMTLIGHSLGAYLSVVYALKYPSRVHKLILLSPAGVPRNPDEDYTDPSREVVDSQTTGNGGTAKLATPEKVKQIESQQRTAKQNQSRSRRLFTYLWEEGYSPFQVVRSSLFWGPLIVGKYSARRFSGLTEEDTRDIHEYITNITMARGSGEYCISHLLAPGAHARRPIVDRIRAIKVPVTFVYGDHDWMDPEGGQASVEEMRKAGNGDARMYIVNNAGHHVYLDNPKVVNDLLVKELDRKVRRVKSNEHSHHPSYTVSYTALSL